MRKMSIIATVALTLAGCGIIDMDDGKKTIADSWDLKSMVMNIRYCTGQPNCEGTITIPGNLEGCSLDLEGVFHFEPNGDDPNQGFLTAYVIMKNSCEEEDDYSEIRADYLYDPETKMLTLNDGEGEEVFDVDLDEDSLVISYEDSDEDAYILIEMKFRRSSQKAKIRKSLPVRGSVAKFRNRIKNALRKSQF